MFRNYFKLAIRNFIKDKTVSLINISGLALGLASVIIILSYVRYELSYDKHYSNSARTYRLTFETVKGDVTIPSLYLPMGTAQALKKEFPEVTGATYSSKREFNFTHNGENITLASLTADTGFFDVFNLPFKYGNPHTALNQENNIVLTEQIAETFFPGQNPVGEIMFDDRHNEHIAWKISGVIRDLPPNTHFKADVIQAVDIYDLKSTGHYYASQYITLQNSTALTRLENKIKSFYAKTIIKFQPVTSIHLHSNLPDEPFVNGDIRYVYIFSLSALLILFIACINYVNLTTVRSLLRVKEVGVRKVLGAARMQLSLQFIGESFLFFCMAVPVAILISYMFWPLFIKMLDIDVSRNYIVSPQNIIILLLITAFSGLTSGTYPAIFLSGLRPAALLKSWQKSLKINFSLRKTLIVLQFAISVSLIVSIIVIYEQLIFINHMPLGFDKDHLIVLPYHNFKKNSLSFQARLEQNHNIKSVTTTSWKLGEYYGFSSFMDDPKDTTKELSFAFIDADFNFIKTMQIGLLEGRNFSPDYASDLTDYDSLISSKTTTGAAFLQTISQRPIIISENTVKSLKLNKPVGQILTLGALQGTVIGVVKDIQGLSLRKQTASLVLRTKPNFTFDFTYIRINSQNIPSSIQYIQSVWKTYFPENPFGFSFVDERLQKLYDTEKRLAYLFTVFAALAICIACSGLFSLVALSVQQRTKEIGIRKVLGADVLEIATLITKDFVTLIIIAILIASPIAWYAMNQWLANYAFRINLSWWVFIIAGMLTVAIALTTVAYQAIKAAMANPVDSLRTE